MGIPVSLQRPTAPPWRNTCAIDRISLQVHCAFLALKRKAHARALSPKCELCGLSLRALIRIEKGRGD
ncbi:hypothetical protein EYF80_057941 [Liparis tanakae]|uniref:Uncharacterized protein n=1 Tax=Liparis tanakae TaxID=230148 RepID=A0A4Z2ETD9_9TELE|nr:hypothetical protein EYF80_057941 [Liparis tanakae]